jgi:hypothetical protein
LRHRKNNQPLALNCVFENRIQRKYSPLYLKRVMPDWHHKTSDQIRPFVADEWVAAFDRASLRSVADFCLAMYASLGLLDGVRVVRSSDPAVRAAATDIAEFFVDTAYEGEIVRARLRDGQFELHEGGDSYLRFPAAPFKKTDISPTRDSRLKWMQSVIRCTHYVAGASEQDYLRREDAPEITYVPRETIDRSDEAYVPD